MMAGVADDIGVLIVDDHPVVREGLRTFLAVQPGLRVAGEAGDGEEAVRRAAELGPDVILLDLKLPDTYGISVLRRLREDRPEVRVLVLTSLDERAHVLAAARAGAAGFLYKDVAPAALAQAVRSVHAGHVVFAPEAAETLLRAAPEPELDRGSATLTARERQVLGEIARGRSNRQIARTLAVSEKTVKTHVSSILMKLGLQDRTQAALYAVRHGLIDPA
ncbi:MAG: response regulator [Streptosporangiales bacterium]|nr:response regulator [Streptosporangiales bacterium]